MEPVPNAIIHQRNRVGRFVCFRLSLSSHSLKAANCCVRSPLETYIFVLERILFQFAPVRFDACKSLPSMENTNGLLPSRSGTSRYFSHRNNLSADNISRRVAQLLMARNRRRSVRRSARPSNAPDGKLSLKQKGFSREAEKD